MIITRENFEHIMNLGLKRCCVILNSEIFVRSKVICIQLLSFELNLRLLAFFKLRNNLQIVLI